MRNLIKTLAIAGAISFLSPSPARADNIFRERIFVPYSMEISLGLPGFISLMDFSGSEFTVSFNENREKIKAIFEVTGKEGKFYETELEEYEEWGNHLPGQQNFRARGKPFIPEEITIGLRSLPFFMHGLEINEVQVRYNCDGKEVAAEYSVTGREGLKYRATLGEYRAK